MAQFLIQQFGYFGLFIVSFSSSTLLSGVYWMPMTGMLFVGSFDKFWLTIFSTLGLFGGSIFSYFFAKKAGEAILEKPKMKNSRWIGKARNYYDKYGKYSLFLSSVPVIGDPIVTVAGAFGVSFRFFLVIISFGRLVVGIVTYILLSFPEILT